MEPETPSRDDAAHAGARAPSVSLPKGGGAIRGIGEKFAANPVTGTGSMRVPIATSPGRAGFGPQLTLSYDSGSGNGPFGLGWSLGLPAVARKTDKGLPKYFDAEDSDVFVLSGAEDLVPSLTANGAFDETTRDGYRVRKYRPRVEGLFARIERWVHVGDGDTHWRSISKDNVTTRYGHSGNSRIADPEDPTRIFRWLICHSYDDKGNATLYEYAAEDSAGVDVTQAHERNRTAATRASSRYLKRVKYGNRAPNRDAQWAATDPLELNDWMFELVFDYGEGHYQPFAPTTEGEDYVTALVAPPDGGAWLIRQDAFSSYRAGFEVRSYRLCRRVLVFHHFAQELGSTDCLVRSTEFTYRESPIASFMTGVSHSGFTRRPVDGFPDRYLKKSLPLLEFEYSQVPTPEQLAAQPVYDMDDASMQNLPSGSDGGLYQWVDLDGEGLSGILTEQAAGWFYKRNLSANNHLLDEGDVVRIAARLGALELLSSRPSADLARGRAQLVDLAGDGQVDLVTTEGGLQGFFERTDAGTWISFKPFAFQPTFETRDPNARFIDLDGDGHSDVLVSEHDVLTWYPSLAEAGFAPSQRVSTPHDDEEGPRLVFADGSESIYVADLSGDGLADLVRIRNGEVCYWPNLGYGRFGRKVTMDRAPWFDSIEQFDQKRIRLADIDGSGTTDIIYLGVNRVDIYRNEAGNGWSATHALATFPPTDNVSTIYAVDLLGNGTACLVWSSPLPGAAGRAMRYVDLMNGQKPHLLVRMNNNLGAETVVQYAPSTKFYLEDKLAGTPWITRLPFPVHVVERVEAHDLVSGNRFVTRYTYHHGYFDGVEREFCGFGLVETRDTEEFAALNVNHQPPVGTNVDVSSHVPPVLTRTWFHTGVHIGRDHVSNFFAGLLNGDDIGEYYREPDATGAKPDPDDERARARLLDDTVLPDGLGVEEEREACRALKGSMLRQEVYALDGRGTADYPFGHPYVVTEQNFAVERLQGRGPNRHGVFCTHVLETLSYHYERHPADPRVSHALTLEVDAYGNMMKTAAVAYGRATSDLAEDWDRQQQTRTRVTYTENQLTNPVDEPDVYRTPLPAEVFTCELTGYSPSSPSGRFQVSDFVDADPSDEAGRKKLHIFDAEIAYQELPSSGRQRRQIERARTLYRTSDLTGLSPLRELEHLEPVALAGQSYRLAFTPGLLTKTYQRPLDTIQPQGSPAPENLLPNAASVLGGNGADQGGYVDLDADGSWWVPSGLVFYVVDADVNNPAGTAEQELTAARAHFFLPHTFADAFAHVVTVEYDVHDLLVVATEDAIGNRVTAQHDYRVLQPALMTDANGNRSQARFDALGLVVGTAVMGKASGPVEGDSFETFTADLTPLEIEAYFDAPDPRPLAIAHLGTATGRVMYDLTRVPACASSIARETHVSDLAPGESTSVQLSFVYSDGFGREAQTKVVAEPGPLDPTVPDAPILSPRWASSGATIYNNKGKPVRQYEPFFSPTHAYGIEQHGVSPTLFYDPPERVVATLHSNHTWEKVVFDAWQQTTYDVSDTVLSLTDATDPTLDADVGRFFSRLPASEYLPTWYEQRITAPLGDPERLAAERTALHRHTPTLAHLDALGRTFLTIAQNRFARDGLTLEEAYPTRIELDIEGNLRRVRDAKTQNGDTLGRVVMRYGYDMLGTRIHQASMEAGERWTLNDVTGKPIRAWDSRGFTRRMTYDELRRPTGLFVENGTVRLAERTEYGETQGAATNHRTRVHQSFDAAGVVTSEAYDFKGNLLRSRRELLPDYKGEVNWEQNPTANDGAFDSSTAFDALNRPIAITAPDGSTYVPTFNEARLLDRIEVNVRGATDASAEPVWTVFVNNIDYNAKGQRMLIRYGNGAETTYEYDRGTFRLTHLRTTRTAPQNDVASQIFNDATTVQDLHYTYDASANITRIEDGALLTTFNGGDVRPVSEYTYDAVYRLIEATGREHIGQTVVDFQSSIGNLRDRPFVGLNAHPNDLQAIRRYTERYEYDAVGNFDLLRHIANGGSWTRTYEYDADSLIESDRKSNRVTRTTVGNGGSSVEDYLYADAQGRDVHGCMTAINAMTMIWDFGNQLKKASLGGGGTVYYVYDAGGQRVRKVIETQSGTRKEEHIYVGGYEVSREYTGGGASPIVQRDTLHVMDDNQRIALVETKTVDQGSPVSQPASVQRYQLGNHLGSASLELNEEGKLISYEEYQAYGTTAFQAMDSAAEVSLKRYRYTGKERDNETGFYYLTARYYAPWLGRFTGCDPLGIVGGILPYAYVNSNPVALSDPNGTDPRDTLNEPKVAASSAIRQPDGSYVLGTPGSGDQPQPAQALEVSVKGPARGSKERERELRALGAAKAIPKGPASHFARRRTRPQVDPIATAPPPEGGVHPSDVKSETTTAEHVLDLKRGGKSSYTSWSLNREGPPWPNAEGKGGVSGTLELWLDLDKAKEEGVEVPTEKEMAQRVREGASRGEVPQAQAETWQSRQPVEREILIKGSIPSTAIESGALRAAKGIGRALGILAIGLTGYELGRAGAESYKTDSPKPLAAESVRQAGAWAGALSFGAGAGVLSSAAAAGKLGASLGILGGPWGAFLLGAGFALVGGIVGYVAADVAADQIHRN